VDSHRDEHLQLVDVVEALPALFAFAPAESFAAIVTGGPRCRFGLRLGMPDIGGVDEADATITNTFTSTRRTGLVLVALSADQASADALMVGGCGGGGVRSADPAGRAGRR